jgi:hypothetical protein
MPRRLSPLGPYRALFASLWEHPDFRALSVRGRLLLLALRTGPLAGIACIFRYHLDDLADLSGLSRRAVGIALRELAETPSPARPWILYDDRVLWIRNGLQFDPSVTLSNVNHAIAIQNCTRSLPSDSKVVRAFLDYYPEIEGAARVVPRTSGDSPSHSHTQGHAQGPASSQIQIQDPETDTETGPEQSAADAAVLHPTSIVDRGNGQPSKPRTKTNIPDDIHPRNYNLAAAELMAAHPAMPADELRALTLQTIRARR